MKSKMIWANFVVKDVKRTNEFYTALGKFVIHFFEQGSGINDFLTIGSNSEIIFTLSAETETEVKEWAERVKNAGGTIFKEVQRDEKGYYGFAFADPDGHKFNVLLMDNM